MSAIIPLVSIVITSYNREKWLCQAISSAMAQDYPNLEIIITDNCSTDGTDELIKRYLSDPRIKYSRNETNIGLIANLKKGFLELATGDYLMNLCSDDYLENPGFISKAMKLAAQYDNVGLIFGRHAHFFENTGKKVPYSAEKEKIFFQNLFNKGMDIFFIPSYISRGWAACILNAKILRENKIDFSDRELNDDLAINLKMMTVSNVLCIYEPCYVARIHPENAGRTGMTSKRAIHNVIGLVEEISMYAIGKYPDLKKRLMEWRKEYLNGYIRYLMLNMVIYNPPEYKEFSFYVRDKYPEIYKEISRSPRFMYAKYIFKNIVLKLKK